jgi:hypothetical protein
VPVDELVLECYGVEVRVRDCAALGLTAYLHSRLPAEFVADSGTAAAHVQYTVTVEAAPVPDGFLETGFAVECDGAEVAATNTDNEIHDWLLHDIHECVARRSPEFVFIRAGVVGWRGKAIVIPNAVTTDATLLMVELLRRGAVYYSNSFAVLDADGLVHAYRTTFGQGPSPEPLPVGMIVAGACRSNREWQPTVVRGPRAMLPLAARTVLPREVAPHARLLAERLPSEVVTLRGAWSDAAQVAQDVMRRLQDLVDASEPPTRTPNPGLTIPRQRRLVAVVTAQHRYPLTPNEQISLRHLRTYLADFDRYLIGPSDPPPEFSDFSRRWFPPRDFASIATYSRLLVSERFYRAFADYEYILIYQFDALVFSGELEHWCQMGWDYVGAPWWNNGHPRQPGMQYDPRDCVDTIGAVGNGGLSLRKVDSAISVLTSPQRLLNDAVVEKAYRGVEYCHLPEDIFWSYEAARLVTGFRIPRPREALNFAFENDAQFCFQQTGGRLPFGCHAWASTSHRDVWEPYLLG